MAVGRTKALGAIAFAANATVNSPRYKPSRDATRVDAFSAASQAGDVSYYLVDEDETAYLFPGSVANAVLANALDIASINALVAGAFTIFVRYTNTSGAPGTFKSWAGDDGI